MTSASSYCGTTGNPRLLASDRLSYDGGLATEVQRLSLSLSRSLSLSLSCLFADLQQVPRDPRTHILRLLGQKTRLYKVLIPREWCCLTSCRED